MTAVARVTARGRRRSSSPSWLGSGQSRRPGARPRLGASADAPATTASLVDAIAEERTRRRRPRRARRSSAALVARRARRVDRCDRRRRPHRPRGRAQRGRRAASPARARARCSPRTRSASCCRTRSTGAASERELQLYGPPRQVLQLRAFPLRRDGEVVGAVGFTRDISESRRVESVRRDFVANVSHELKTPIGALGLLAETMAATDDAGGDAPARGPGRARVRPACAHRRRPARPQHDRGAGSADARADAGRACSSRSAVDLVQAAADGSPTCRCASRPSRPTSRSSATRGRCAARW